MIALYRSILAAFLIVVIALPAMATTAMPETVSSEDEEELDAVHHVADGDYLDFTAFGKKIYLPRIFLIRKADGGIGLNFFRSTPTALASGRYHFEDLNAPEADPAEGEAHDEAADPDEAVGHDDEAAEHDEAAAAEAHGEEGLLMPIAGSLILDLSITRHLVFVWFCCLLLILCFSWMARRYASGIGTDTAPRGKAQNALEALILYVRDEIAAPNIGAKADRFVPYLLTLWFFILSANLVGLVPLSATSTANITITAVLAIFTFVVTNKNGSKDYWKHIFWPPGIPLPVKFILVPIEIIGLFIKPFVLAVRLFANMTAGHLVILSLLGLIFSIKGLYGDMAGYLVSPVAVGFALFIYLIEVLVSFLQAYIFVMLSALYIGTAVEEHDHDDHHAHSDISETEPVLAG